MRIESELNLDDEEAIGVFAAQFIERVATLSGISPQRIIVTELAAGSVIVFFRDRRARCSKCWRVQRYDGAIDA